MYNILVDHLVLFVYSDKIIIGDILLARSWLDCNSNAVFDENELITANSRDINNHVLTNERLIY